MKLLPILLIISTFISCSTEKSNQQQRLSIDETFLIKEQISDSISIAKKIESFDNSLIIVELANPYHLLYWDKQKNAYKRFGKKGGGDGEYRAVADIDVYKNKLAVLDPKLAKIDIYELEKLSLNETVFFDNKIGFPVSLSINSNSIVVSGFYSNPDLIYKYDLISKKWTKHFELELFKKDIPVQSNHHINQHKIELINTKKFITTHRYINSIKFHDIETLSSYEMNKDSTVKVSSFDYDFESGSIIHTSETIINYIDFDFSNSTFYGIYSGKKSTDENNSMGRFIHKIRLHKSTTQSSIIYDFKKELLSISKSEQFLYLITLENDSFVVNSYPINKL